MARRTVLLLALLLATLGSAPVAGAQGPTVANGGGRGTVDGTPFSQFGFGLVVHPDGTAEGRFTCLMAGASAVSGLRLMAVDGRITAASVAGGTVVFDGSGSVNMGDQGRVDGQTFRVTVTEGGPGVGTLQLTLIGPVAMELPTETVLSGRISVR